MAVDKLNPQSLALFFSQNQRHINTLIVVLLALYLLAFAAELVWRIIPEPQSDAQNTVAAASRNTPSRNANSSANISALQRLNLFGKVQQAVQPVVEAVSDAPETRLNLVLTGVVSSSTPENGAAIIEHRGSQDTYGVGEKIEGTNAVLRLVQEDRVIIRNGSRDETLMLEGIDYAQANRERESRIQRQRSQRRSQAMQPREEKDVELSQQAVEATRQLRESPDSFIDFISVAPHRANNELIGYRVSPGRNSALFQAVGLENGDIITQINGLDVTDPDQTMEAMGALRSAPAIELTVSRKGDVLTLFLELPEPNDG